MEFTSQNVSMTIGDKSIIDDISLRVRGTSFVGLLGPNGSGKSTFLKCVYKAIVPDHGGVFLDEMDLLASSSRDMARRLAVVSQFQELSFDLSVRQMVLMGRTPFKRLLDGDSPEDMALAEKALADVGLAGFEDRSYATLSGGEKQRVVLARAIAQTPSFLVLDEPTNHLDIKYQLKILSTVKSLGIGVLAAMHDLGLSALFCDYVYLLKEGRIVAEGTPEEVLTSETIRDVYDVGCRVRKDPDTGRLMFLYDV